MSTQGEVVSGMSESGDGSRRSPDACQEMLLLVACVRRFLNSERGAASLAQAAVGVDWMRVMDMADRHRVAPLVYRALVETRPECAPPGVLQELERRFRLNAARNLILAAELGGILAELRAEGIEALPFKGVVLAEAVYGSLLLRASGDLDLLIHRRDAARGAEVMFRRGYRFQDAFESSNPRGAEWQLERVSDGLPVELRWRATSPQYTASLDLSFLADSLRPWTWRGQPVESLPAEETLLLLCVHGGKHHWSRLMWICDVAQLLRVNPQLDWPRVWRQARRLGVQRSVALGLLVARDALGADIPEDSGLANYGDWRARRLAAEIRGEMYCDRACDLRSTRYWFLLLNRPADQLLLCRRRLLAVLRWAAPNERDRRFVRLPERLGFLYYLIRPVRLVVQHMLLALTRRGGRGRLGPDVRPESTGR